jgi:hypothetical protein
MQEPSKFCPRCNAQNQISAAFCYSCGAHFQQTPFPQQQPKKQGGMTLLIICGVLVFGCAGLTAIGSLLRSDKNVGQMSFATPTPSATLSFPRNETQPRTMSNKGMPEYAQVSDIASKLGFQLGVFKNNGGSIFMAEATRFISGREFRFVAMGPASDRVDTVRIQAWGVQTRQARRQLETWATQVLESLNRGQLPGDFIQQLYAGANVGDDGVSNGFCNVQLLQKPSNPGVPNANDRISIDLIFDKTN